MTNEAPDMDALDVSAHIATQQPQLDASVDEDEPDDEPIQHVVAIPYPDGQLYDLMGPNDLDMVSNEQYRRIFQRLGVAREAHGKGEFGLLSDDQQREIRELEIRLVRIAVPDAPEEAIRSLKDRHRAHLVNRFLEVMGVTKRLQSVLQKAAESKMSEHFAASLLQPLQPSRAKSARTTKRSRG
jgi:hypothetical protein